MTAQAQRILREWGRMFDTVDALILPVSAQPPFEADQDFERPETLREIMMANRPLFILNLMGLPGATVRTLDSRPIPLGVQIVGDRMDDLVCLDAAAAIERELAFDLRPIDPV
ncbi:MAG: amidase family protein [Paracoccaceae bacterium]